VVQARNDDDDDDVDDAGDGNKVTTSTQSQHSNEQWPKYVLNKLNYFGLSLYSRHSFLHNETKN